MHEIENLQALEQHVGAGRSLTGCALQGLDLRAHEERLGVSALSGAALFGCTASAAFMASAMEAGALVFPRVLDVPYHAYRAALYSADELMTGYRRGEHASFFSDTLDARIYRHYQQSRAHPPQLEAFAQRIHDQAMDDAIGDLLTPTGAAPARVVAFMGGHAMLRSDPAFLDVARCAQRLAQKGYAILTGGGPGAMEAANLGGFLAGADAAAVGRAVAALAQAPSYKTEGWFDAAYAVRDGATAHHALSVGIPTWFYGHEPTNLFCTHVAKYFSNALREDGLLAIARHGVVFARGGPGTLQEVFLDLCQNAYATQGDFSAMVFLGRRFWLEERAFFPLIQSMGHGTAWGAHITCVDAIDEVVAFIDAHPPRKPG